MRNSDFPAKYSHNNSHIYKKTKVWIKMSVATVRHFLAKRIHDSNIYVCGTKDKSYLEKSLLP